MTPAPTITEFLEARIEEDEAVARAASVSMHGQEHDSQWDYSGYVLGGERDTTPAQDEFITTWWPARVLAECTAKRAIVQVHQRFDDVQRMTYGDIHPCAECGSVDDSPVEWPCRTLKMIAAVYASHPDYPQEWAL